MASALQITYIKVATGLEMNFCLATNVLKLIITAVKQIEGNAAIISSKKNNTTSKQPTQTLY